MFSRILWMTCLPVLLVAAAMAAEPAKRKGPTMASVLAESKPGDWRPLDPENTLYESRRYRREDWFQTPAGRIELGNVPIPVRLKNEGTR